MVSPAACPVSSHITAASLGLRYKLQNDAGGWLSLDKDSGSVKVKRSMDRESHYVTEGNYKVLVLAYDNGKCGILLALFLFSQA